ncbi:MAG: hypothetical protein ACREEK_34600 [Bradyrhizobium sp.]
MTDTVPSSVLRLFLPSKEVAGIILPPPARETTMEKQSNETRELMTDELESVSGGYIWLPTAHIIIAYLTGAGIRAGEMRFPAK